MRPLKSSSAAKTFPLMESAASPEDVDISDGSLGDRYDGLSRFRFLLLSTWFLTDACTLWVVCVFFFLCVCFCFCVSVSVSVCEIGCRCSLLISAIQHFGNSCGLICTLDPLNSSLTS
jgi:hypothetical protein